MAAIAALDLPARLVHVIDRGADSVGHGRQGDPTHVVRVRADDRRVMWNDRPFVAETVVTLHRPAKTTVEGKTGGVASAAGRRCHGSCWWRWERVRVWRLEARSDASAEWLKELLMRRSGRRVKRSVPVTTSGLPAGLWVWRLARAVIGDHGADTVERLPADHLPLFAAPPNPNKDV